MKRKLRSLAASTVPKKWRLPLWFHWQRLTGGMEARRWQHELAELKRWENRDSRAIDIGANEGLYSYKMAKWFASVEAFEPNPNMAERLRGYGAANIRVHQTALSSVVGKGSLLVPISERGSEYPGWGTLEVRKVADFQRLRAISIDLNTLDSFRFDDVAVIKIDAEGHESDVLTGAIETIQRCRPVMLIEVKDDARSTVKQYLQDCGYDLFFWRPSDPLSAKRMGELLAKEPENLFALPREKSSVECAVSNGNLQKIAD